MSINTLKISTLALSIFAVTGCGTGSDSGDKESKSYTVEQVASAVKCTNQAEGGLCEKNSSGQTWGVTDYLNPDMCNSALYCFDDGSEAPQNPGLTRFVEGKLIPVYYREKADARFVATMDYIEGLVGYQMFDRKGVVNIDISDPYNIDLSGLDTDWGFILSQGTSIGLMSGFCSQGTVSSAPFSYNMSSHIVSATDYGIKYPAIQWSRDHRFTWVNLDSVAGANNGLITCNATAPQDVATHEFSHALGMYNHFSGFGFDGAWGKNAERVLKTMYSGQNPQGQPFDSLVVEN
ncbi:hypothetical protein [Enterovibrio baiacu]|uniref:hypothetical protein n=1 Tax=Enterovibrio baiacu TaxID=2491023 RepID=UPI0010134AAF|nr:hypothetical protein [Enterovibrio baiacu]MBE1275667.1 hypothetical protein [Enterovibrio baiacu]